MPQNFWGTFKEKRVDLILLSDKVEFRSKSTKRDKEGHIILIKTTIYNEDIC